jgi:hypothetical protein
MVKRRLSKKAVKKKITCSPCQISASISVYTNVCSKLGKKGECGKILDKLSDDKISLDKAFKQIKKLAKGHKRELATLRYVDRLLKEG